MRYAPLTHPTVPLGSACSNALEVLSDRNILFLLDSVLKASVHFTEALPIHRYGDGNEHILTNVDAYCSQ
jgi:hypothetical protein